MEGMPPSVRLCPLRTVFPSPYNRAYLGGCAGSLRQANHGRAASSPHLCPRYLWDAQNYNYTPLSARIGSGVWTPVTLLCSVALDILSLDTCASDSGESVSTWNRDLVARRSLVSNLPTARHEWLREPLSAYRGADVWEHLGRVEIRRGNGTGSVDSYS